MADPGADLWETVQREQERIQTLEVDESLILSNLRLSPAERLQQHDRALAQLRALQHLAELEATLRLRAKD